jgi:hypothetical protein
MEKKLYRPFRSTRPDKKFSVYVKGNNNRPKLIHFGARGSKDFRGTDGLKATIQERDAYLARASKIKNGKGELAYKDQNSPQFWNWFYLWLGNEIGGTSLKKKIESIGLRL